MGGEVCPCTCHHTTTTSPQGKGKKAEDALMKEKEYEEMVEKLFELTVKELDKDMMDIELLVKNLILVEPGE